MKNHFICANTAWDDGNFYRAFRLFLAGAKAGDVSCQSNLGYFYDNGIGVTKNLKEAARWYLEACEIGHSSSGAHNLAILYRDAGELKNAKKYFKLAATLGDPDSLSDLAELALKNKDQAEAVDLLKELLAHGKTAVTPSVRRKAQFALKKLTV